MATEWLSCENKTETLHLYFYISMFHLVVGLSSSLTCASLALADAGIEMYDLVIGCSMVRNNNIMWL